MKLISNILNTHSHIKFVIDKPWTFAFVKKNKSLFLLKDNKPNEKKYIGTLRAIFKTDSQRQQASKNFVTSFSCTVIDAKKNSVVAFTIAGVDGDVETFKKDFNKFLSMINKFNSK